MKLLILAEKKSLAEKIAKGLTLDGGTFNHRNGYYEVRGAVLKGKKVDADVYYLAGHIVEVDLEKTFAERYGFPERFFYRPKKKDIWERVKKAVKGVLDGKYDFVVEAGDPDREGELLVREVLTLLKVPKEKIKRAWWNSETPKALKEAFENLKDAEKYDSLYLAGRLRQIGDAWVGINLSRHLQEKAKNRNLSIGRVQTPVLALVVKRDREIENFQKEKYYVLVAKCEKDKVKFNLTFLEAIKDKDPKKALARARIIREDSLANRPFVITKVEKKRLKQRPPKLPKLADIQHYAGTVLKKSAEEVLKIVQKLYERGVLSYPRTESNYLAEADEVLVKKALKFLGREDLIGRLREKEIRKFIFNTADVEKKGHHAIIPLAPLPKEAGKDEKVVYDFVVNSLLANLYGYYVYDQIKVEAVPSGKDKYVYGTIAQVPVVLGWREVFKPKKDDSVQKLPPLEKGDLIDVENIVIEERETQPPPRFTSPSLIKTMEKLGIGTPATRHLYEKILLKRGYLKKGEKGVLISTEEGRKLVNSLSKTPVTDPALTGEWENHLKKIEFREIPEKEGEEKFKVGIKELVKKTAEVIKSESDLSALKRKPTSKMIKYALSLCSKRGIDCDRERLKNDWDYCKSIIETYGGKEGDSKPTEKQLAFAGKLSKETGIPIPEEALKSKKELSRWIDSVLKKKNKAKREKK